MVSFTGNVQSRMVPATPANQSQKVITWSIHALRSRSSTTSTVYISIVWTSRTQGQEIWIQTAGSTTSARNGVRTAAFVVSAIPGTSLLWVEPSSSLRSPERSRTGRKHDSVVSGKVLTLIPTRLFLVTKSPW